MLAQGVLLQILLDEDEGGGDVNQPATPSKATEGGGASKEAEEEEGKEQYHYAWGTTTPKPAEGHLAPH